MLNPGYATGTSASFGRIFFNVVRNGAPADLQAAFSDTGYLCTHADGLLIPFGNTPLGNDGRARFCGQSS